MPFLTALAEVLEEEDEASDEAPAADSGGAGGGAMGMSTLEDSAADSSARRAAGVKGGRRAEAVLASLLNCVWLEPHAATLPKPPKEVLRLLSGVSRPLEQQPRPEDVSSSASASDERASARAAAEAARHLCSRSLLVLLLLLFHEPEAHPGVARAFAELSDPLLNVRGPRPAHAGAAAPLNFAQLLAAVLGRLQEGTFCLLLYCLVQKNEGFRRYCLCRADADVVLVPLLQTLHHLPAAAEGIPLAAPPASSVALLLTLLTLTGDRGFCEGASRTRLPDGGRVLGSSRPLLDITVASLLVVVLLRVAHWNFATCRDAFFNQAVSGILGNLASHGLEHLHWHATGRMVEVGQLLARNALRKPPPGVTAAAAAAEEHRSRMVGELLKALLRLISGCLRVPLASRNCALVYALRRAYPPQFAELEEDPELGAALQHIRAVTAWFQAQCPPGDAAEADTHAAELEAAASRLPGAVDALAACRRGSFAFAESASTAAYFLPVVWRAALKLLPEHVCWSKPTGTRTAGRA